MLRDWNPTKIILALAMLGLNDWVLGLFLNHRLIAAGGSISELGAADQPHFWVFRALDITAGLLVICLAYLLKSKMPPGRIPKLLALAAMGLGISNALDAMFNLRCSETLSANCSIPITLSLSHFSVPSHAYTSTAIGFFYLALPLLGLIFARQAKFQNFFKASLATLLIMIASLASILIGYAVHHGVSVKAWWPSQATEMLVLSAWFIFWFMAVESRPHNSLPKSDS